MPRANRRRNAGQEVASDAAAAAVVVALLRGRCCEVPCINMHLLNLYLYLASRFAANPNTSCEVAQKRGAEFASSGKCEFRGADLRGALHFTL